MVNILIVYAHHLQYKSFNAALRDFAVKELREQGHKVVVTDLYAQNFNPLPTKSDTGRQGDESKAEEYFHYTEEMGKAYKSNDLPKDVTDEIEKVKAADLIIFQFPLHWGSVPTILKGWFDRILLCEFAFILPDCRYEKGLLKGKKAMLSLTTAEPKDAFDTHGNVTGNIDAWLWPIHYGILYFCGFEVLTPHVCYEIHESAERRDGMLSDWRQRLRIMLDEKPLEFPSYHNR